MSVKLGNFAPVGPGDGADMGSLPPVPSHRMTEILVKTSSGNLKKEMEKLNKTGTAEISSENGQAMYEVLMKIMRSDNKNFDEKTKNKFRQLYSSGLSELILKEMPFTLEKEGDKLVIIADFGDDSDYDSDDDDDFGGGRRRRRRRRHRRKSRKSRRKSRKSRKGRKSRMGRKSRKSKKTKRRRRRRRKK